jgi:precorrin-6B methylase 2
MFPKAGNTGAFSRRVFAASIPPAGAVVDASAGAGRHTMVAAHAVGPRGQVLAFEPEPASYRALRANVREHGFEDRVTALPLRLAAWARLHLLNSFPPDTQVDLVKLAIEGGDVNALHAIDGALALSPSARLFVDCNPAELARAGSSAAALLVELRELGFHSRVIEEIHGELSPAGTWLSEAAGPVQLFCERADGRRRFARRARPGRIGARADAGV